MFPSEGGTAASYKMSLKEKLIENVHKFSERKKEGGKERRDAGRAAPSRALD
ncbi:Hypothetical predicted protein [Podarcis lilfordi]|uniref:Uncharacterized protein n=1 Tax=Podarcis lilfordi TaxID=74358 RepID=A0AA35KTP4_9SAUR|nr:Hypothetical predicted protein [Podarcis lilfordi]